MLLAAATLLVAVCEESWALRGYANPTNIFAYMDPRYGHIDYTPHRVRFHTRMINGYSGFANVTTAASCEFLANITLKTEMRIKIRGAFAEQTTFVRTWKWSDIVNVLSGRAENVAMMDAAINMGRKCADHMPTVACPVLPAVYRCSKPCVMDEAVDLPGKIWNSSITAFNGADGSVLAAAWMEYELDDTEVLRHKLPSTAQRNRRQQRQRKQPRAASTNSTQ